MADESKHEREYPISGQNGLVGLLYGKDCPVGYKCLANDCMECLNMHADEERKGME